jgi:ethanolamine ammonia-lyase small subunit
MTSGCDVAIILADGLSASAIDINAVPLTRAIVARLSARQLSIAPIVLASQARVAIGDPIAAIIGAKVSVMVIGERPGLSGADSLGIYLTRAPKIGMPDSKRNCISNVRDGGLAIVDAADLVVSLVADMLKVGVSGVGLKAALDALPCLDANAR